MRPITIALSTAAAALAIGLVASQIAHAQGNNEKHDYMHARITAHIDDALDNVKANAQQRAAVYAARDHVFAAFAEGHGQHKERMNAVFDVFAADRLDGARVTQIRGQREAEMKRIGDAMVQAFYDVHDALTAPQRKALVDYVHNEMPRGKGGWHAHFLRAMVEHRVEHALSMINATAEQRQKVNVEKDRVLAVLTGLQDHRTSTLEPLLNIFLEEKIDESKVQALRAQREGDLKRIGDTIVQSVTELHAVLNPAQRRTLVDFARQHAGRHHGG